MMWYWWVAIAVAGAAVIVSVAFAVWGHHGSTLLAPQKGVRSFAGVLIKDLQNNLAHVAAGDHVLLRYIGQGQGNVTWTYQVGNTHTPSRVLAKDTKDNPLRWKVPGDIFGPTLFRVTSANNLKITATSKVVNISPVVSFKGAGSVAGANFVVMGTTATWEYTDSGSWIHDRGIKLELASSPLFTEFKEYTGVTVNTKKKTVSWVVNAPQGIYKLRLSTNSLVAAGYPHELSYEFQWEVGVQAGTTFNGAGQLGTVSVTEVASGRHKGFSPGETVQVAVQSDTISSMDWYYSLDKITWSVIVANVDRDASNNWTIPSTLNGDVAVRVVTNGTEATTADESQYAQIEIAIGSYMTITQDAAHMKKEINYEGEKTSVISQVRLYVTGYTDIKHLNDIKNWRVGWYTNPEQLSVENRILPIKPTVTHVNVATGGHLPESVALCDVAWEDTGYDLVDSLQGPVSMAVLLYLPVGHSNKSQPLVVAISQTKYTLKS